MSVWTWFFLGMIVWVALVMVLLTFMRGANHKHDHDDDHLCPKCKEIVIPGSMERCSFCDRGQGRVR